MNTAIVLKKENVVNHVEVVFGGDGVVPVAHADTEFLSRLAFADQIGVVISSCGAGLKRNGLVAGDLPKFITVFPYGIVRTLDLVAQGYAVMQY